MRRDWISGKGTVSPVFKRGKHLRQPPAAFLLRETHSRVEYGRAEIQVRSLRDAGYVVLRRIRANADQVRDLKKTGVSVSQAVRRASKKPDTTK